MIQKFLRYLESKGYVIVDTKTRESVEDRDVLTDWYAHTQAQTLMGAQIFQRSTRPDND